MKWQQPVWNRPVLGQPVAEADSSLLSLGRSASGEYAYGAVASTMWTWL
jgi:hypothetical protein